MKLTNILMKCGTMALKTFVPGAGVAGEIIGLVNNFMGDDKQLSDDATGAQLKSAVESLPPDLQKEIMDKKYDVEIAEIESWTERTRILAENDATGSSTRPDIAMILTCLIVFIDVIMMIALGYATVNGDVDISAAWPMALALQVFPASIVKAYFSLRSADKELKHATAHGLPYQPQPKGLMSLVGNLLKR